MSQLTNLRELSRMFVYATDAGFPNRIYGVEVGPLCSSLSPVCELSYSAISTLGHRYVFHAADRDADSEFDVDFDPIGDVPQSLPAVDEFRWLSQNRVELYSLNDVTDYRLPSFFAPAGTALENVTSVSLRLAVEDTSLTNWPDYVANRTLIDETQAHLSEKIFSDFAPTAAAEGVHHREVRQQESSFYSLSHWLGSYFPIEVKSDGKLVLGVIRFHRQLANNLFECSAVLLANQLKISGGDSLVRRSAWLDNGGIRTITRKIGTVLGT